MDQNSMKMTPSEMAAEADNYILGQTADKLAVGVFACAVFIVSVTLSAMEARGPGAVIGPALWSAAYLIIAARVALRPRKELLDYVFILVCVSSLPIYYVRAIVIWYAPHEWSIIGFIVGETVAAAFAIAYFAWSFRLSYPPATKTDDGILILIVILMSAVLGLVFFCQLAAALANNLDLIKNLPPRLVYTPYGAMFYLNSLIIISGAIMKTIKTQRLEDAAQILTQFLSIVSILLYKIPTFWFGPLIHGQWGYVALHALPKEILPLAFAVAFFAAPIPSAPEGNRGLG